MLGLCALHLLARAVAEFYQIQGWQVTLCCDNKQALELSSYKQGWIRLSAKCADIRRNIRSTKQTFQGTFRYVHVYGHMGKYLAWNQLNLMQQMNCVCNMLAKKAVAIALLEGYHNRTTQLLPNEDVALVIWGNKVQGTLHQSYASMQAKKLQGNISPCEKGTHGLASGSARLTGSIST
jgi:hypothetical protein